MSSRIHRNVSANHSNTFITSNVKNALQTRNIQKNITSIQNIGNIRRFVISASFALSQSINKKTHLTIAAIPSNITAIDAIISPISGMHSKKNPAINVIIDIMKSIFLLLYSVVVRATNNQISHEIIISMLVMIIIILNDKLGWKKSNIHSRMKNSPFIQKKLLILSIFLLLLRVKSMFINLNIILSISIDFHYLSIIKIE